MNLTLFFKKRLLRSQSRVALCAAVSTLFTFSASAQHGIPVNPDYNPATPDYIELEGCEQSNDGMGPGCPETITYPEHGSKMVIQGAIETVHGSHMFDGYRFELTAPSEIKIKVQASHLLTNGLVFANVNQAFYDCDPDAPFTDPNGIAYELISPTMGASEFTFDVPAGLYWAVIYFSDDHVEEDFSNVPCNSMEYQVEMSHIGYFPGDICDMAIEIEPEDTFNESRVMDDMANAYSFGNFGCASEIGQAERWYKFTAEKTTSFISARREGNGNFNPVIEVYNSCEGNPVLCQNDDSGAQELVIFPTVPNQEYYFRVYHSGPQALNNTAMSAAVAHVPTTQLRSLDCNRMNLLFTDIIRSDWPSNSFLLENWQFKFEMIEAPHSVYEITSPNGSNPQFRMSWFPQAEAGKTYIVSTRPKMYQGPTWGDYGSTCIIGTAPEFAGFVLPDTPDADFGNAVSLGDHGLKVWPNPAYNEVTISFTAASDDRSAVVTVFDASGKLVDSFQKGISGASVQNAVYETSALPAGVYLVRVQTESGVSTSKLVVSH